MGKRVLEFGMKFFLWAACLAAVCSCLGAEAVSTNGVAAVDVVYPDVTNKVDFAASEEIQVAMKKFRLQPGFYPEMFASEPLIANPVSFVFDDAGRAYVVETHRRRTSVFDIRNHRDWLDNDLSFRTTEDRAAFLRRVLSPTNSALPKTIIKDRNGDGKFDWHDLEVESERIRLLEDRDFNGVADSAITYADDFRTLISGVAAGIATRKNTVWFTCIPDLWRLRDVDKDGKAEVRDKLLSGFGVHIAFGGHDMHGLKFGPDGKLYFTIADRGFNVTNSAGAVFSSPDAGAVMRCNLDGTEFEVVHGGLRNPQELAFDQYGNLFTGDNNGDGGDAARWVQVVEGGDSGWTMGWQHLPKMGAWNREMLWGMSASNTAAYILPPVAHIGHGPAGIAYYPGVGLPTRYANHFFMADFPGGVRSFALQPKGATFEATDLHDFLWELNPVDVDFGPRGGLYVLDWVQGWEKTGKGRLYRIYEPVAAADPFVEDARKILAAGVASRSLPDFIRLLSHPDMRVRLEAQFTFVEVGPVAVNPLVGVLKSETNQLARLHALWALGQLGRHDANAAAQIQPFLTDSFSEVRAQAAKLAGDLKLATALTPLIQLAYDSVSHVRFEAIMSLGKLRNMDAVPAIMGAIQNNRDQDAYIRHACVMALTRLDDGSLINGIIHDNSRPLRMAAVLALRKLGRPEIAQMLGDDDPAIVTEAARAINDLPIEGAMSQLAGLVTRTNLTEAAMRRALNANFRLGKLEHGLALTESATKTNAPENLRAEAIRYLSMWANPPGRDPVVGLWRPLPARDARGASLALRGELETLLGPGPETVRLAAMEAAARLETTEVGPQLFQILTNAQSSSALRVESLRTMRAFKYSRFPDALKFASDSDDPSLKKEASIAATQGRPANALAQILSMLDKGTTVEKQIAFSALGNLPGLAADSMFIPWLDRLQTGKLDPALRLDVLEAAAKRKDSGIKAALDRYEASRSKDDPLANYRETLMGGDAAEGKKLFLERADVACMRCHKINNEGGEVGPDLSHVGQNPREYLLESIVAPNAKIAKGYDSVLVKIKDGGLVAGIVKNDTETTLEINSPEDGLVKIDKSKIESRTPGQSPMPAELATMLTKRELRNLIEYLASLK
jgi:quinoprotein glucose dehydrogenase